MLMPSLGLEFAYGVDLFGTHNGIFAFISGVIAGRERVF